MKKLKFYYVLSLNLFLFAFFVIIFSRLSFYLLSLFFILVISEKFLRKNPKFKKLSELKQKVNPYYRYFIMYPWLFLLFWGAYSDSEKIWDSNRILEEQKNKPVEQQLSIKALAPKHIENKNITNKVIQTSSNKITDNKYIKAKVLSNHDGDTLTVSINDKKEKIRLLGIDTAEMQQGYWGKEAKKYTEKLTKGKNIDIETDIQARDKYGRLLAYVYVDGKFLNNELIKNGYAQLLTYTPNIRYVDTFTKSQTEARNKKLNIWSDKGLKESPHDFRHKKDKPRSRVVSKPKPIVRAIQENNSIIVHVNAKTGIYHYSHCRFYDCKNCYLEMTPSQAESNGYRHCQKE